MMVAHIENVHGDAACADCKGFRKIPMQRGNNTSGEIAWRPNDS
jgi:hypothetical protein